jgi:hypothetical protein
MIHINRRGQTLVESLAALTLLLMVFFCLFYIFLIAVDKIRSLDTVYHLARVQEVGGSEIGTPLAMLQCFCRLGFAQASGIASPATPVSEVSFSFTHNFAASQFAQHKSLMRIAQPNADFLTKSYPGAAEDTTGLEALAQLELEKGELIARSHAGQDAGLDLIEEQEAVREAGAS